MRRRPGRVFGVATAMTMALLLAACAPSSGPIATKTTNDFTGEVTGSVVVWGGANLTAAAEVVLDGFKKENPGVSLSFEKYPYAEYPTKMKLQLSGGASTPDVMIVHDFLIGSFIDAGWLADVSSGITPSDYLKGSLDNATRDGKVYGVPGQSNPIGFWYRKDVFDSLGLSAPTTFEQYVATAQKLKAKGLYIDALDPNTAVQAFYTYLGQSGASVFDRDGKVMLGNGGAEALDRLKSVYDAGYLFKAAPNNSQDYWTAMNAGTVVARFGPASDAGYLAPSLAPSGPSGFGHWVYVDPPRLSGTGTATSMYDQSFIVVNAKSANKPAALALAKYLTTNVAAAQVYDNIDTHGIVVRQTPSDIKSLEALEKSASAWKVFGDEAVNATKAKLLLTGNVAFIHRDSRSSQVDDIVKSTLPNVFSGRVSSKEAITQMTDQISAIK